uniref:Uncharacterized protein n=1 Tax=Amphimedon queenslandica TaxID=400682 RepID=A0A1X7SP69_AMPQE
MYEVIIRKSTSINPSPKNIGIPSASPAKEIKVLKEIRNTEDRSLVNIKCKVVSVGPARVVCTGKVQDVLLPDNTGTVILSCCEKNIDLLQESICYNLPNFSVNSYLDERTLTRKGFSKIKEIDAIAIDDINSQSQNLFDMINEKEDTEVLHDAKIISTVFP